MRRSFPALFLESTKQHLLRERIVFSPREKQVRKVCSKLFRAQNNKDGDRVLTILDDMSINNIQPHIAIYRHALNALVRAKRIEDANKLVSRMKNEGFHLNSSMASFMVNAQRYSGNTQQALEYFQEFKDSPTLQAYSSLLNVHVVNRDKANAIALFEEMKKKNIIPSTQVYGSMLDLFHRLHKYGESSKLIEEMRSNRVEITTTHWNLYLRAIGKKEMLLDKFEEMKSLNIEADAISYQIVTVFLVKNGCEAEAIEFYVKTKRDGFKPTALAVKYILKAAQVKKDVALLRSVLKEMQSFGIKPTNELIAILTETRETIKNDKRIVKETLNRKHRLEKRVVIAKNNVVGKKVKKTKVKKDKFGVIDEREDPKKLSE